MGAIAAFFTSKIAGPIFAIGLVVCGIALAFVSIELSVANGRVTKLEDAIDNPKTGWVVRNAQCETNVATLGTGLMAARDDIARLAQDTRDRADRTAAALATTLGQIRGVKISADKLLALPASAPRGSIEACTAGAKILKTGAP